MSDPLPNRDPAPALTRAQDEVADVFGSIAEFWGFTRTQGRVYGLLFLSPEPLGHRDIRDRLEISAGSASMTLTALVEWGVVHRRDRVYVAETDFWRVITGVLRRRERELVSDSIGRIAHLVDTLSALPQADERNAFALRRAIHLLEFFRLGRNFLDAFVQRHPIHSLLHSIAKQAARFPGLLHPWNHDVRIGA